MFAHPSVHLLVYFSILCWVHQYCNQSLSTHVFCPSFLSIPSLSSLCLLPFFAVQQTQMLAQHLCNLHHGIARSQKHWENIPWSSCLCVRMSILLSLSSYCCSDEIRTYWFCRFLVWWLRDRNTAFKRRRLSAAETGFALISMMSIKKKDYVFISFYVFNFIFYFMRVCGTDERLNTLCYRVLYKYCIAYR